MLPVRLGICLPDSCYSSAFKLEDIVDRNRQSINTYISFLKNKCIMFKVKNLNSKYFLKFYLKKDYFINDLHIFATEKF